MIVIRKPIEGFDGYEISSDGIVWSCWAKYPNVMTPNWNPLKGRRVRGGYIQVALYKKRNLHINMFTF